MASGEGKGQGRKEGADTKGTGTGEGKGQGRKEGVWEEGWDWREGKGVRNEVRAGGEGR